ncbi:hypothetical protein GC173_14500 [bacterium]|nr:hypothetical protein [bacterium]
MSAMLEALTASDTRVASRVAPSGPGPGMPTLHTPLPASAPPRPQVPQVPVAPKTPSNPLDVELYGAVNPPKRNDDGTIPFSLD